MSKQVYTMGQVAKMLGLAPKTVSNSVDAGRLEGWRLPAARPGGKGHRRVTADALRKFCVAYNMPIPKELQIGGDSNAVLSA